MHLTYPRSARYRRAEELLEDGAAQVAEVASDEVRLVVRTGRRRLVVASWTADRGYRCSCPMRGGACSHVAAVRIVVLAQLGRDPHPLPVLAP